MIPRPLTCRTCGVVHEAAAHHDADAMDREADRATKSGDGLAASIWRARAGMTRAGLVVRARREPGLFTLPDTSEAA
jgi:hypothetical protein